MISRFGDQRLKRLARRLIFFECPHLFDDADGRLIAQDIAARRCGEGKHGSPPWMTIEKALAELDTIDAEASDAFKKTFRDLL